MGLGLAFKDGLVIEACPALEDAGIPCRSVTDLIAIGKILQPGFGASADA